MASQRPSRPSSRPFVTRRSILGFSGICVVSGLVFQSTLGSGTSGPSTGDLLSATSGALFLVAGIVAWVEGVVLAMRAGSLIWLVVAVLPFVPINSVMCAMFCPAAPADRKP
jgi:hypothetical protein